MKDTERVELQDKKDKETGERRGEEGKESEERCWYLKLSSTKKTPLHSAPWYFLATSYEPWG